MSCSKSGCCGCGTCGSNGAVFVNTYHGNKALVYDKNKDLVKDISILDSFNVNLSNCCAPLLVFDLTELTALTSKAVENSTITISNAATTYSAGVNWAKTDDADVDLVFPATVSLCGGTKVVFDVGATNYTAPNYKITATFYESDGVTTAGTIDFTADLSGLTASLTQVTFTSSADYISIPDVATGKNPTVIKILTLPTIQRTTNGTTTLLTPLNVQCTSNVVSNFITCGPDDCPC